jgi:hypothetical protein
VRIRRSAAEVVRSNPADLYDLSRPIRANSPEIRRLGRFMQDYHHH